MSVEALSWAINAPLGGTPKLVLIGLANHASADFDEARPSVATLARYAHVDRRTVQRALRKLEEDGWIQATGTYLLQGRHDRAVTVYRLRGEASFDYGERGVISVPHVHDATPPVISDGAALVPPEPSLTQGIELRSFEEPSTPALSRASGSHSKANSTALDPNSTAGRTFEILRDLARRRHLDPPRPDGIAKVCAEFPDRDVVAVAKDLEFWLEYGNGARKQRVALTATLRSFLKRAPLFSAVMSPDDEERRWREAARRDEERLRRQLAEQGLDYDEEAARCR